VPGFEGVANLVAQSCRRNYDDHGNKANDERVFNQRLSFLFLQESSESSHAPPSRYLFTSILIVPHVILLPQIGHCVSARRAGSAAMPTRCIGAFLSTTDATA
jgi:hypothetical protein